MFLGQDEHNNFSEGVLACASAGRADAPGRAAAAALGRAIRRVVLALLDPGVVDAHSRQSSPRRTPANLVNRFCVRASAPDLSKRITKLPR